MFSAQFEIQLNAIIVKVTWFIMSVIENRPFLEVQTQFLCAVPIKKIKWKVHISIFWIGHFSETIRCLQSVNNNSILFPFKDSLLNLSWDEQKQLLDQTTNSPELLKFPLETNYVIRFLRFVIDALEKQNIEIHDDYFTTLCSFQSKSNDYEDYSYKHYQVLNERTGQFERIILKENRNKISHGTTGLNVWESALALSEWAIQNKHLFGDKHILELGAGTGLSSLLISKFCSPKSVHISDGNEKVVDNLLENVSNNFEQLNNSRQCFRNGEAIIGNNRIGL